MPTCPMGSKPSRTKPDLSTPRLLRAAPSDEGKIIVPMGQKSDIVSVEVETAPEARPRRTEFRYRIRVVHKEQLAVPDYGIRTRTNFGPIRDKHDWHKPDIDGRIAAALDKLFRSKSQKSRHVLSVLQNEMVGHLMQVKTISSHAAPYLRTAGGICQIYRRPDYRAVRLIISSLKGSDGTSFRLPRRIRALLMC